MGTRRSDSQPGFRGVFRLNADVTRLLQYNVRRLIPLTPTAFNNQLPQSLGGMRHIQFSFPPQSRAACF